MSIILQRPYIYRPRARQIRSAGPATAERGLDTYSFEEGDNGLQGFLRLTVIS